MSQPKKVWCPPTQQMVMVTGIVSPLANKLKELFVKQCLLQKDCEKIKHGHYGCLVGKRLQGSRW